MIITKDFVYIHYPKTGGTFVTTILRRLYLEDDSLKGRIKRKLVDLTGTFFQEIGKHNTCEEIPPSFTGRTILSNVRNPYDRYVSLYEFGWWRRHTRDHYSLQEIRARFPHFPAIDFDEYLELTDQLLFKELKETGIGAQSRQFIAYFFKDPQGVASRIDDDYIKDKQFLNDMYPVRFLRQENLNRELYDFLVELGFGKEKIAFILDSGKIFPVEGGRTEEQKWQHYYTPDLKKKVRRRERLLFEIFPEYDI